MKKTRNRSYGRRSPLDKLPDDARHELRRLCASATTLREVQAWLKAAHGCLISKSGISEWWIRKKADEKADIQAAGRETASVCAGGFEISVTAPGAAEVRLQFRPLAH